MFRGDKKGNWLLTLGPCVVNMYPICVSKLILTACVCSTLFFNFLIAKVRLDLLANLRHTQLLWIWRSQHRWVHIQYIQRHTNTPWWSVLGIMLITWSHWTDKCYLKQPLLVLNWRWEITVGGVLTQWNLDMSYQTDRHWNALVLLGPFYSVFFSPDLVKLISSSPSVLCSIFSFEHDINTSSVLSKV